MDLLKVTLTLMEIQIRILMQMEILIVTLTLMEIR